MFLVDIRLLGMFLCISKVGSLTCYDCRHVTDPTLCTATQVCHTNEVCYHRNLHLSSGLISFYGCQPPQECGGRSAHSLVGRDTSNPCHECCSTDLCNKHLCSKTDGGWTDWGSWSHSDVTCGVQTNSRSRSCTNPAPANGGQDCVGSIKQSLIFIHIACPVDGDWSLWSEWGRCSVSCNVGIQQRNRSCSQPVPENGGVPCLGDFNEFRECMDKSCADGGWSSWGTWEPCTATCNTGTRRRHRQCDNPTPSPSGQTCPGSSDQAEYCNQNSCSVIDCYDIKRQATKASSGVYKIVPHGAYYPIQIYCDMETDGGGWTVFQRRFNGSVDFNQVYAGYETGFGNAHGELWLGLWYIQAMTARYNSELRLDLTAADGSTVYEVFKNFHLTARPGYILRIDNGTGTAGDGGTGLSLHNGGAFHTKDYDDTYGCAVQDHGGWWYNHCAVVNLNGEYIVPGTESQYSNGQSGIIYFNFKQHYSLKHTQMMFRRM